ncbi:MAG TPA: zinc-dependent alcohol dehydrogenase family protein [Stellaceae bacterium]|nr:zinc-dependent alcohol dehydrogenase family protein [Stellaceae bacterium]
MRAMAMTEPGKRLELREMPRPRPGPREVLVKVNACGVCRTDLHILDGELPAPHLPLVPGHEIVGRIAELGAEVRDLRLGERVGIPWLGWTCGVCKPCRAGRENLCNAARFTGYQIDGGYAEYAVADARYCFRIPEGFDDVAAAPLLCAGLIGFRTLRLAGAAERVGIYGFGAAAHIVAQVIVHEGRRLYAFTRPGDRAGQEFARGLGALWAGGSDERPPEPLDAALIFAPVGALVPAALAATAKGGSVVCGGIHMSDIPAFPYRLLWEERVLRSVANLTRADGEALLALAPKIPIRTHTERFALADANDAVERLRRGAIEGAAVLVP